jgi:hypothetical protein
MEDGSRSRQQCRLAGVDRGSQKPSDHRSRAIAGSAAATNRLRRVAQTAGIVFEQGVWKRVPIKTAESTTFFVLHEKLSEIGFVDWAARQPGYVFEALHEYKDPAKSTSKNLNRLLRNAGARGGVEVLHSLRGNGIDEMRAKDIDGRARRLQAGHTLGDEHDQYGFRALSASACHQLATAKLKRKIDWSIFQSIDFDKFSEARRGRKNDSENE